MRVIEAFLAEGIAESDLAGSTGYGYDDAARERYESLLARIFRAERVLARLSIVSGTHAIVAALDALLVPGQRLLCANGAPYDTLALRARRRAAFAGRARRGATLKSSARSRATPISRRSSPRCATIRRRCCSFSARAVTPPGARSRSTRSNASSTSRANTRRRRSCSSTTATANWSKSANRSRSAPT